MNYFEVKLQLVPNNETTVDVVSALIGEIGFESFVSYEEGVVGYIQQHLFDKCALDRVIENLPLINTLVSYSWVEIEDKNWNEEWEKDSFHPIYVDDNCVIHRATDSDVELRTYDIAIEPKFAFGTGHHETTRMMVSELLKVDFSGKRVLDAGCGTGILAIAMALRGAEKIVAYDIDKWSVENTKINLQLNKVENAEVRIGDASVIAQDEAYDTVVANINRNILLEDIPLFCKVMKMGAQLYLSGFYTEDIIRLEERSSQFGLVKIKQRETDNWACIVLQRK